MPILLSPPRSPPSGGSKAPQTLTPTSPRVLPLAAAINTSGGGSAGGGGGGAHVAPRLAAAVGTRGLDLGHGGPDLG
jgi:hypothetical protein